MAATNVVREPPFNGGWDVSVKDIIMEEAEGLGQVTGDQNGSWAWLRVVHASADFIVDGVEGGGGAVLLAKAMLKICNCYGAVIARRMSKLPRSGNLLCLRG